MGHKHQHEEHINHESWAIPYGDLITLLLAFFVVMYSISSVNEGKYRVLSAAIASAFTGSPKSIEPIQVGQQATASKISSVIDTPQPPAAAVQTIPNPLEVPMPSRGAKSPPSNEPENHLRGESPGLKRIADEVENAMSSLIDQQLVIVRRHDSWLEVELKTDILFPSGVATFSPRALPILQQLAKILLPFPNPLRIEGYTDNVPINTPVFPSNWELSAARAASVARLFVDAEVDPHRLAIMGWGEYHPTADNSTADGRNLNRRVLVVVFSNTANTVPSQLHADKDIVKTAASSSADQSMMVVSPQPAVSAKDLAADQPIWRSTIPTIAMQGN